MTDLRKAAEMALESLEDLDGLDTETECVTIDVTDEIEALRQALAQPEQEPMSFQTWRSRQHGDPEEIGFLQALKHAYESGQYSVSPPRKEWVRLTDEEIDQMWRVVAYTKPYDQFRMDVARAIEAKLKEKNT